MLPKLKRLSGKDVINIFEGFGFSIYTQHGNHVKLRRIIISGKSQNLTISLHRELDIGTLKAIYRQATRYISENQLKEHFYQV